MAAVASWLLIVATLFTQNLRARGDFPGFPFMCVQGYGAYLMLMMLKSTDSIFKCACAMSPVTDWKLYGESCGMLALHFHHTAACTWIRVSVRFGPVEFVPVCNCTRPTAAATGWRRRPGSPWDDTCAVFLCWELVSWALCAVDVCVFRCVKTSSPLIYTASAFSERYLGMPLRDDSRYQVCLLPPLTWSLNAVYCCTRHSRSSAPALTLLCYQSRRRRCVPPWVFSALRDFATRFSSVALVHQITGCRISGLEMLIYQSCRDLCEHIVNNQISVRDSPPSGLWIPTQQIGFGGCFLTIYTKSYTVSIKKRSKAALEGTRYAPFPPVYTVPWCLNEMLVTCLSWKITCYPPGYANMCAKAKKKWVLHPPVNTFHTCSEHTSLILLWNDYNICSFR